MAQILEWESDTSYDKELKKIPHYQIHSEMLPFIGTQYHCTKILLVGESHYIDDINSSNNEDVKKYYKEKWYEESLPEDFPNAWWFNTRTVVHNFLCLRRSRAHSMFRNPSKEIMKAWDFKGDMQDSDAFNTCAFMNYYQRPAASFGQTFDPDTTDDKRIAFETLNAVVEIIKPIHVIFLSNKAYKEYTSSGARLNSTVVSSVSHPTCAHWHTNGKDKFKRILEDIKTEIPPTNITYYKKEEIEKLAASHWKIINRKAFINDKITFQAHTRKENVYEVVIRFITKDDKKIGIGYRFDYRLIWIWDYDNEEYVESKTNDEIQTAYKEFGDFIENL